MAQDMWHKLGENRKISIKNQISHSNGALNANVKWSKNHDDNLMHPCRAIVPQSSKNVLT